MQYAYLDMHSHTFTYYTQTLYSIKRVGEIRLKGKPLIAEHLEAERNQSKSLHRRTSSDLTSAYLVVLGRGNLELATQHK